MTEEKQNISLISELYTRACGYKEGCEHTFLPTVHPSDVGRSCFIYGKLLYLLKKFVPTIWEGHFKDFVELEFVEDFEKQLECPEDFEKQGDIKWSNILKLWGYACDIEYNLIGGGELNNFYRQVLASLRKNERWIVNELESKELAKWNRNAQGWFEHFFYRSSGILCRIANSLDIFLNGVDVNENPTARLALIEQFLLKMEYGFFREAQAIGPYMSLEDYPPYSWNDGTLDENFFGSKPGTLRAQIIGGRKIRCSFSPDGKNSTPIEWTLEGSEELCGYSRTDYKREVFDTWNYTTGKFLGQWQAERLAYWYLESAPVIESYAEHAIKLSLPLFKNSGYEQLAENIIKVVKNNQPEWRPGEVQWSYIADLDRIIHECRLAREIYQTKNMSSPDLMSLSDVPKQTPQIPSESKSPPMSLKELAGYFGESVKVPKIRTMMRIGSITFEKITRESYYFDLRKLPAYVKEKIEKQMN